MENNTHTHDGSLIGITINGVDIRLTIAKEGKSFYIDLVNVSVFKADNFLFGNIIFETRTKNIGYMSENELTNLLEPLIEEGLTNSVVLERYISERKLYFELNPSYGCQITSICDNVEYKEMNCSPLKPFGSAGTPQG